MLQKLKNDKTNYCDRKKRLHLICSEDGVSSIEYALIASLIALAIVFAVTGVGDIVQSLFQAIADSFPN